jgi:hypothetical protein
MKQKSTLAVCILISCMFALVVLAVPAVVEACPTCKEGLANGNHDAVGVGYFWSILLMMSMPFLIFAGWGIFIWRACRQRTTELEIAYQN